MAKPFEQMNRGVEIGRVHLRVGDLDRALAFYEGVLGFEVTERFGRAAALLRAGAGARPHLWLHTSESELLPALGPQTVFALRYPRRAALGEVLRRVEAAQVTIESSRHGLGGEMLYLRDPDGNGLELYHEAAQETLQESDAARAVRGQPVDLASLRAAADTTAAAGGAAPEGADAGAPLTEGTRARLHEMRQRLLTLHKVLLEDAKTAYELDRGRVSSNASLLQLVISDPWFAWLHQLSELVVRIDEWLHADVPATESDGLALLDHVARLLSPEQGPHEFARRYYEALQRQPAVIVAHAEVRRILKGSR